jgi:hypothetical protein
MAFDLDDFVDKYKVMYEAYPDKNDDPLGPTKNNRYTPDVVRTNIVKILRDNRDNTACASCIYLGRCCRINWGADRQLVKVTGCDLHPDQKKFPGHSTSVSLYAAYFLNTNANTTDWDTSRDKTTWSGYDDTQYNNYFILFNGTDYRIDRNMHVYDTSAIPTKAVLASASQSFYCTAVDNALGSTDEAVIWNGSTTCPHSPPTSTDYNRTNYTGECAAYARSSFTASSYNWIPFSDLTAIVTGGTTRLIGRYSADPDDDTPTGSAYYGVRGHGSTGTYPPQLNVVYTIKDPQILSGPLWHRPLGG